MDRLDSALLIIPLKYLPVGTLVPLQGFGFEAFVNNTLRHWNRNEDARALETLAQALADGYTIKHMAVDVANATFFLVRGEADNLLYGQN